MKHIEHLDVTKNCVVDLSVISLNSHDHCIMEKLLVLFYICGLERLWYTPHLMEEDLVFELRHI